MEKKIKACGICGGRCMVRTIEKKKKYAVVCLACGNESEEKTSGAAAISAHNRTVFASVKSLFKGAPDAKASPK